MRHVCRSQAKHWLSRGSIPDPSMSIELKQKVLCEEGSPVGLEAKQVADVAALHGD